MWHTTASKKALVRTHNFLGLPRRTSVKTAAYRDAVHLTFARRRRTRALLAGPGAVLLALSLTACGSNGRSASGAPTATASTSASAASTDMPTAPPTPTPETTTEATPPSADTAPPPIEAPTPETPQPAATTDAPAPQTPYSGNGTYATAGLDSPATASGTVVRFAVQVEDGVPVDPMDFAAQILAILTDPRGWQGVDGIAFEATSDPGSAAFIVTLATPRSTDRLCYPLDTGGWLDCYSRGRAVINSDRWLLGADSWGADLAGYRQMVVNHEVGHAIGHGHLYCPGSGEPAPVMQQQTIALQGCAPNAWPAVTGG